MHQPWKMPQNPTLKLPFKRDSEVCLEGEQLKGMPYGSSFNAFVVTNARCRVRPCKLVTLFYGQRKNSEIQRSQTQYVRFQYQISMTKGKSLRKRVAISPPCFNRCRILRYRRSPTLGVVSWCKSRLSSADRPFVRLTTVPRVNSAMMPVHVSCSIAW